ncbi:MAG TPA: superoxide dismutase [Bacteroidales bacterium]|nr:superoxide dismutase [Bacteroidales bacterium]
MKHELPVLPYAADALNAVISPKTIEFHYGKHHQAYVNNLNNLIPGSAFENASLETIIREADGGIFNNGAQVWNHTFYFMTFSATPQAEPTGPLADAIVKKYGSFADFKAAFAKSATTLFGSGWAWLVLRPDNTLDIVQEPNAGNPMRQGLKPLLTCDVWEHAYYLDYQNRRPDYIEAFWKIVDWKIVSERFLKQ